MITSKQRLKIFQKYLLHGASWNSDILNFISKCVDDIKWTEHDKMISCYRKILIIFYYFWATHMLAFYVAYPSIHTLQCCISHSNFEESRYPPFLLEALPLPLTTIFLQTRIPNVVLESSANVLEPQINPTLNPSPPRVAYRPPWLHRAMTVFNF